MQQTPPSTNGPPLIADACMPNRAAKLQFAESSKRGRGK